MTRYLLQNQIAIYERARDFEMALQKSEEYVKLYPKDTGAVQEYQFLARK